MLGGSTVRVQSSDYRLQREDYIVYVSLTPRRKSLITAMPQSGEQ